MADSMIGNRAGVAAANVGGGTNKSNFNGGATGAPQSPAWDADLLDVATLRTRLAAIDGTFYTAARLNIMTLNDMVYAVRQADLASTIKQ